MLSFMRAAFLASALITTNGVAEAAPVTLADALSKGAATSPRLEQARARLEAAEARARQAGLGPNPEVGLTVENFGGTGPYRSFRSTETTLEVSQRLEFGGKRRARVSVARADRDAATVGLTQARADLERDIRVAHATLRAAADRAVLAENNVDRANELVRTTGLLVDSGRDPPLRRLRAQALLAEATAEASRTFGDYRAAQRGLSALTGIADPDIAAGAGDVTTAPSVPPPGTPTLEERLASAERDAARARIDLARSEGVPDPTVGGGFRRFSEGRETAVVATLSIQLPVRNRNQGNLAAARSDVVAAEANLAQIRLDGERARRDAYTNLTAAEERVAALSGPGAAEADEALRIARIGYQAGKFSLVELLDAQTALNSARLALIQARLDRARALADLLRANAQ